MTGRPLLQAICDAAATFEDAVFHHSKWEGDVDKRRGSGLAEAARNGAARGGHLDDLGLQCSLHLIPLCATTLTAAAVPPPEPAPVRDVDVHALDLDAALGGLPTNHDAYGLPLPERLPLVLPPDGIAFLRELIEKHDDPLSTFRLHRNCRAMASTIPEGCDRDYSLCLQNMMTMIAGSADIGMKVLGFALWTIHVQLILGQLPKRDGPREFKRRCLLFRHGRRRELWMGRVRGWPRKHRPRTRPRWTRDQPSCSSSTRLSKRHRLVSSETPCRY